MPNLAERQQFAAVSRPYRFTIGQRLRFAPRTGVGLRGATFDVLVSDREMDYDGPCYTVRFANGGNARMIAYESELSAC